MLTLAIAISLFVLIYWVITISISHIEARKEYRNLLRSHKAAYQSHNKGKFNGKNKNSKNG